MWNKSRLISKHLKIPSYISFLLLNKFQKNGHIRLFGTVPLSILKSRVIKICDAISFWQQTQYICSAEPRSFTVTWQARIWLVEVWEKYVKMNIFSTIFPEKRKGKSSTQHRRPIKLAKLAQLGSRHRQGNFYFQREKEKLSGWLCSFLKRCSK